MDPLSARAGKALATGAGKVLAGVFSLAGRARPGGSKSLHPRGELVPGRIDRQSSSVATGVEWLDRPGKDDVLVRLSRAVGLPEPWPDVLGLAIRVPVAKGYGDLLLATTGSGVPTRFLLRPTRRYDTAVYSTLLPYRTPAGPLLLAAFPRPGLDHSYDLAWSGLTGPWQRFATLVVPATATEEDALVSFDPVLNVVPGLEPYAWTARLREFSYAASRRARRPASK